MQKTHFDLLAGRLRCPACAARVTFLTDGVCDHCWGATHGVTVFASWLDDRGYHSDQFVSMDAARAAMAGNSDVALVDLGSTRAA